MRITIGLCALMLAATPVAAFAGEGNGPSFPGMKIPDESITTSFGPGPVHSWVSATIDHSAQAAYDPANSFPDNPLTFPTTSYASRGPTAAPRG